MSNPKKILIKAEKAMSRGHFSKAIEHLDELLLAHPEEQKYLMMRGEAHLRSENYESGLVDFAKVVEADSKNIRALVNFAVALIRCNKQNDAKDILEYVLELDPESYDAHINLCNVYQTLGKSEESLKLSIKAIQIKPDSVVAFNNLGTAFADLNMVSEAREALTIAIQIDPSYIPTVINLAQIQVKLENYFEGARLYEEALQRKNISPNEAALVKYYLGYAYLHQGELCKGWDYYENGFGSLLPVAALRSKRKFLQPQWQGESIGDKTLLIWREQGLGDEIEFATCLHDVSLTGMNVILECEPRLIDIFKRTYPAFTVRAESIGPDFFSAAHDFDVQCAIGSLPRIFRREMASFAQPVTPLTLLESSVQTYKERLSGYSSKKLVGICWRSGLFSIARNLNYTALLDWKELLVQQDFQFVNLQYGDCENELLEIEAALGIQILRWPDLDLKNDLENVLALIKNLDAVVTVGTAVSSLAGSCDVPTYLLAKPGWMMLGQTDRYPWYSCVTPLLADKDEHLAKKIPHIPELIRKLG
jgi:tetratricopeptide (TPR) repeat protein